MIKINDNEISKIIQLMNTDGYKCSSEILVDLMNNYYYPSFSYYSVDETSVSLATKFTLSTQGKEYKTIKFDFFPSNKKFDFRQSDIEELKANFDIIIFGSSNNRSNSNNFLNVDGYEYIEGVYPTPMIIVWDHPNNGFISGIDYNDGEGAIYSAQAIDALSNFNIYNNFSFFANPGAYVWYDENKKIQRFQYSSFPNLIWLLHTIHPKDIFYLTSDDELKNINCLKKTEFKKNINIWTNDNVDYNAISKHWFNR